MPPAGGLGCHINAMDFVSHIPQGEYPAGARSTLYSEWCPWYGTRYDVRQRDENGVEPFAHMELFA